MGISRNLILCNKDNQSAGKKRKQVCIKWKRENAKSISKSLRKRAGKYVVELKGKDAWKVENVLEKQHLKTNEKLIFPKKIKEMRGSKKKKKHNFSVLMKCEEHSRTNADLY